MTKLAQAGFFYSMKFALKYLIGNVYLVRSSGGIRE